MTTGQCWLNMAIDMALSISLSLLPRDGWLVLPPRPPAKYMTLKVISLIKLKQAIIL